MPARSDDASWITSSCFFQSDWFVDGRPGAPPAGSGEGAKFLHKYFNFNFGQKNNHGVPSTVV